MSIVPLNVTSIRISEAPFTPIVDGLGQTLGSLVGSVTGLLSDTDPMSSRIERPSLDTITKPGSISEPIILPGLALGRDSYLGSKITLSAEGVLMFPEPGTYDINIRVACRPPLPGTKFSPVVYFDTIMGTQRVTYTTESPEMTGDCILVFSRPMTCSGITNIRVTDGDGGSIHILGSILDEMSMVKTDFVAEPWLFPGRQ